MLDWSRIHASMKQPGLNFIKGEVYEPGVEPLVPLVDEVAVRPLVSDLSILNPFATSDYDRRSKTRHNNNGLEQVDSTIK